MAIIFASPSMGDAHLRVAIVSDQGAADLLVHRVHSRGMAWGDARWYMCETRGDATAWVFFTSEGMAQVTVCFVDSNGAAGWQTESRYRGRFK